jgi:hypothetical protein
VATHVQVANIVEEDDARGAGGVCRWREQGTDHHVAPAWFIHYGRAEVVVLFTKLRNAFGERAGQFRPTLEHKPCGFATGVGIDYADALHVLLP